MRVYVIVRDCKTAQKHKGKYVYLSTYVFIGLPVFACMLCVCVLGSLLDMQRRPAPFLKHSQFPSRPLKGVMTVSNSQSERT